MGVRGAHSAYVARLQIAILPMGARWSYGTHRGAPAWGDRPGRDRRYAWVGHPSAGGARGVSEQYDMWAAAAESDQAHGPPDLGLRPYQDEARAAVARALETHRGALVVMPTGCHRAGQQIMLHSGRSVRVEDVAVGDRLMGPDGTHRTVLQLARGRGEMCAIMPTKGDPWVVNMDHILTLQRTPTGTRYPSDMGGAIIDVSVREWLTWPKHRKHIHKLFRTPVDFAPRPAPRIAPYVMGALLGDGSLRRCVELCTPDSEIWPECQAECNRLGLEWVRRNHCTVPTFRMSSGYTGGRPNAMSALLHEYGVAVNSEHKHIPFDYSCGSRQTRLDVLAGLLDTDGHLTGGGYDYISASQRLSNDVAHVARSLGLAAYVRHKRCADQHGTDGDYWRVSISGDCSIIPCRVERKRAPQRMQKKSVLRTGFTVVPTGTTEDYYGFSLDGDQRYLLGDFTVTHNTGKSRTAGAIVWDQKIAKSKVLILCPTIVLCQQMYSDMRRLGLTVAIEQASNRAVRPLPDVTVASVATMRGDRLRSFRPDDFGLVIADEAHRSTSDAYTAIFQHFSTAKRLGLTATPDRSDGVALSNVFDAIAYDMSMLDAIEQGWLVPLRFRTAETDFDPKALRKVAGDVDPASVAAELVRSGALHQAANTLADLAGDDRAVAFLPTVASSQAFCAEINARHRRSASVAQLAAHVDGTTPAAVREEYFAAFRDGITRVISNVAVLTEGWDAPHASVIALLSPTTSRSRICQMIGRGTRLCEGKTHATVIDFCPGRLKRGRLASPADALAGKMLPDDVHEHIGSEGDLAECIKKAEKTAKDIEDSKVAAEQASRIKARATLRLRDEVRAKKFIYGVVDHDMHALFGARGDIVAKLEKRGVNVPQVDAERRKRGLCSIKQANVLARAKLNPDLTWKLAREAIDALAANGWVVPEHIAQDKRFAR